MRRTVRSVPFPFIFTRILTYGDVVFRDDTLLCIPPIAISLPTANVQHFAIRWIRSFRSPIPIPMQEQIAFLREFRVKSLSFSCSPTPTSTIQCFRDDLTALPIPSTAIPYPNSTLDRSDVCEYCANGVGVLITVETHLLLLLPRRRHLPLLPCRAVRVADLAVTNDGYR